MKIQTKKSCNKVGTIIITTTMVETDPEGRIMGCSGYAIDYYSKHGDTSGEFNSHKIAADYHAHLSNPAAGYYDAHLSNPVNPGAASYSNVSPIENGYVFEYEGEER